MMIACVVVLLIIAGITNLFVGFRCVFCPEGYEATRKLDVTGKVLLGVVVLAIGSAMMLPAVNIKLHHDWVSQLATDENVAKLDIGMGRPQVEALIGKGTAYASLGSKQRNELGFTLHAAFAQKATVWFRPAAKPPLAVIFDDEKVQTILRAEPEIGVPAQ